MQSHDTILVEDVHNEGGAPDFGLDNDGAQDLGIDNEEGEQSEDHAATNTMIHSIIKGATRGEISEEPGNEEPNEHAKIFFEIITGGRKGIVSRLHRGY
jgi:hypothetical protein